MQAQTETIQKPVRKTSNSSGKVSLDKFLRITEGKFAEWVDGEVIYITVTFTHQNIANFLTSLMRIFAEEKKLGKVSSAPYSMKIPRKRIIREPDIIFVSTEHLPRMAEKYLEGACDIAVEIISPESRTRDRRDKFLEYAQAGITEYWLIEQSRKWAQFYTLDKDGFYELTPLDEDGRFNSQVMPGFWIKPEWLWQEELPGLIEIQRLWGLI